MNGGLTYDELGVLRAVVQQAPQTPPLHPAEIEKVLAWFPSRPLREWFARGNGGKAGEIELLSLDEAMRWRRETLKRDLPSPLSSADRFLPLVRMPAGFLVFDGKAQGFAIRRTKQPETYVRELKWPLKLSELLEAQRTPAPLVDDEDDDDVPVPLPAPRVVTLEDHFETLGWTADQGFDASTLEALCRDAAVTTWFKHLGPQTRTLHGLKLWSLGEALIARDELEESASGKLRAQLHHLEWMPIAELTGGHRVIFWAKRGVRLHRFDRAWQEAPWSRQMALEAFLGALSGESNAGENQNRIIDPLYKLSESDEDTERDFDDALLEGVVESSRGVLETFFSLCPHEPFAKHGDTVCEPSPPKDGVIALLRGSDGVDTVLQNGGGVQLRVEGALVPWCSTLTRWVLEVTAARAVQALPGVQVTRNFVGHFRVELPMLPFELARELEEMGERWELGGREFCVVRSEETVLDFDAGFATVKLSDDGRAELAEALDQQREPELRWDQLNVTFVFKPLKS